MGELVDARTAAERLGVDVRTLYAYVSRGALRRVPGPDGRSSRYDSDELSLLARRSRPRKLPRPAGTPAPAPPNSDFALGARCHVARMPPQAATAIFAVARTAGWIAHAAEGYAEPRLRFRGRAVLPAQSRLR
jgi:hypothetical protein